MRLKPNDVDLDNEGASYEPGDEAALRESMELTEGMVVPPVVYRNPFDNKWKCLEGNHRVLILKKRGWGDTPIEVTEKAVPRQIVDMAGRKDPASVDKAMRGLLEWKLVRRVHVNGKRRKVPISEWRAVFSKFRDELGWSQEQIARQCGWNQADVSRILTEKYETHVKEKSEKQKEARAIMGIPIIQDTPQPEGAMTQPSVEPEPGEPSPSFPTPLAASDTLNRALQDRFRAAEAGDVDAKEQLRWVFWHVGRKLLAMDVELLDPHVENPRFR